MNLFLTSPTDFKFGFYEILLTSVFPIPLSLVAAYIYSRTQTSNLAKAEFSQSLVLFSSLIAVLVLIIGDNLAKAFGLFGALTIIRFRTPVKSVLDAIFMFGPLPSGWRLGRDIL